MTMKHRTGTAAVAAVVAAVATGVAAMTPPEREAYAQASADQAARRTPGDERAHRTVREALAKAGLTVPRGRRVAGVRDERHDETPVTVVRYQRDERRRLGGEHVSAVVTRDGTLLGYTRLVADAPERLLSRDRAREIALNWLRSYVPRYARGLQVQWVERHDEHVRTPGGRERVISGMKVKTRHASGLYTWVIVDGAGRVLTYERDVRWDGAAGRRGTQMWLHDAWIAAHEGTGRQPEAPYAKA